jgi:hypothetical protein
MFLDYQNEFSVAQDVEASDVSENIIDTGKNAGGAYPLKVHAWVDGEAFAGTGELILKLIDCATTNTYSGASTLLWSVGPIHRASMVDGFVFTCPPVPARHRQYLRMGYEVATQCNVFSAGKISANLVLDLQTNEEKMGLADRPVHPLA